MKRSDLISSHRFIVCFGSLTTGFAKISGISREYDVESINEGGVNEGVILLRKPQKSAGTLIFEHGVGLVNQLSNAFDKESLGVYFKMPGTIIVFNDKGEASRMFGFNGAVPVKWSVSDLDAQGNSILIDRVEIMHQGVFELRK